MGGGRESCLDAVRAKIEMQHTAHSGRGPLLVEWGLHERPKASGSASELCARCAASEALGRAEIGGDSPFLRDPSGQAAVHVERRLRGGRLVIASIQRREACTLSFTHGGQSRARGAG